MANKMKILFLCTGNSCRSQIAEDWTRHLRADRFEAYSAGTQPRALDPSAVRAMAEAGIDISMQQSKGLNAIGDLQFDYVVTLCDNARKSCPFFPAKTKLMHQGFDDPPKLAEGIRDEEEAMGHYRRVRDEIRAFVEKIPESLR